MIKIEIFDPAMCCATGVCGPVVDPELVRISIAVNNVKKAGIDITRYNLANEPDAFVANETVTSLLHEKGPDVLPVILVDGKIMKEQGYPSNEELARVTGIKEEELSQKPRVRLNLNMNK